MFTKIKTPAEVAALRESGKMLATVLQLMAKETVPGITPQEMSHIAAQELKKLGGSAPFEGYYGYPDIICISVNSQVQHGIPTDIPLQNGDVVNYDFGVEYRGMITDAGISVGVGAISKDAQRLLTGTQQALTAGIAAVHGDCQVGDISAAIEAVLRHYDLGIVRDLVGHGVGHQLHEDPNIPNYGRKATGPILQAGMTIAIEPITTLGGYEIRQDNDGWTLWTADGSWSAQFEHTLLVTNDGAEVLTRL